MNKTAREILSLVRTKEDLNMLESEIETLLTALFKKNVKKSAKESVRSDIYKILENHFAKVKWDPEALRKILINLQDEISQFKTISLTIAFEPSAKFMEELSNWVKTNIGEKVFIDLSIDRSVIAGLVVAYKGIYKDYSARKVLNKKVEKGEIEFKKFLI